jgi:hypothetical protein
MAKPLMVSLGEETFSFNLSEVERGDIYGSRKRVPMDAAGMPCTRASISQDGRVLVASGMSAQGYFDEQGHMVSRSSLVGVGADGAVLENKPSTLGIPQNLRGPVDPSAVLDLELLSVYLLEPMQTEGPLLARLKAGDIFECDFNYTASLEVERCFMLANETGCFALVGKPLSVSWIQEGASYAVPIDSDETQASEDLDFEML